MLRLFAALLPALAPIAAGRTVIEFWHAQDATITTIEALAEAFNAAQDDYQVVPRYTGSYRETALRLVAALGTASYPVLVDAETTALPRLVADGAVLPLDALLAEVPQELIEDIFPNLWAIGEIEGRRYGLPWNTSLPVLVYNASLMNQLGLAPPQSWEAFEALAGRLTTRQTKGYLHVTAAFIFEAMVTSRGGSILTADGQPNFDSPEALAALTMLKRMTERGHALVRSFGQLEVALVDFVRTKALTAITSLGFLPQGQRFAIAFEPGVAPLPLEAGGSVPLMGAQLAVVRGASEAEQRGAMAFWQFLMEVENLRTWVEASYFLPVRRAVVPLLEPWYAANPMMRVGLDQLAQATYRPKSPAYAVWQSYLEEALERSLLGGMPPEQALAEAQRRAEAER
jgi:sn-glycerol 3-phosphate transport system substrate-binding protein